MGRNREIGKDDARLYKVNSWFEVLYSTIITRELGIEKLKVGWDLRARRYEERIKLAGKIVKKYWQEKEQYEWKETYGREREKYYIRNGWDIGVEEGRYRWREEIKLIKRKGDAKADKGE